MIKNKEQLLKNAFDESSKKSRKNILEIIEFVLEQIEPQKIIKEKVRVKDNFLYIQGQQYNLKKYQNIYVVGAGKATYKMALSLEKLLGKRIKKGYINVPEIPARKKLKIVKANKATHPLPSPAGVKGAKEILKILKRTKEDDLVITLISGGGSALLPLPAQGVALADLIKTNSILIKSPLTINEVNTVRKHLSGIKGGRLVDAAYPAKVVNLVISDVCGDDLSCIASGPTVPDPSTFKEAVAILKHNDLWLRVPKSVRKRLQKGLAGSVEETPKPFYPVFREKKVDNFILANHQTVLATACSRGKELGYHCHCLTYNLKGEARVVGAKLVKKYRQKKFQKPTIVFAVGETTVEVKGSGCGGRNQELVLAGIPYLKKGMVLASVGTDGVDGFCPPAALRAAMRAGPSKTAGAIADSSSKAKLNPQKYLKNNDSYSYFKKIKDSIKTGPTGTNVGDLVALVINY